MTDGKSSLPYNPKNVSKTTHFDLCISCEICSNVCPNGAIKMKFVDGQFIPIIDESKCKNTGLCLDLCPGIDLNPESYDPVSYSAQKKERFFENYSVKLKDKALLRNSTSGGAITGLLIELIKDKSYDSAFVLDYDYFNGEIAKLKQQTTIEGIKNAAKSKYVPASVLEVVKFLRKNGNGKHIIVCTSCQLIGIKKLLKKFKISEENLLFLGLFCDRTLNYNIYNYFEQIYGKKGEKLARLNFRDKEDGWPGGIKLFFDSGRAVSLDKSKRTELKKFFSVNRCIFCMDKLNELADISFGDCYIKSLNDKGGISSVIVRTAKGKRVFDKYSHLFEWQKNTEAQLLESQKIGHKKKAVKKEMGKKNLRLLGKKNKIRTIWLRIFLSGTIARLKKFIRLRMINFLLIFSGFLIAIRPKKQQQKQGQNVLIVGGKFKNKGSQAMILTALDRIRKEFPKKNVFLLSTYDFNRKGSNIEGLKLDYLPWTEEIKIRLLIPRLAKFFRVNAGKGFENEIFPILKNTSFIVDVSGYGLSTRFGHFEVVKYLSNIMVAKKFSIPYFILPQTFGKLNFSPLHRLFLGPLSGICLKYPEIIFAREKNPADPLKKYTKDNVLYSMDTVLINKGYDLKNIFGKKPELKSIEVKKNSVCIIPNDTVIRFGGKKYYSVYKDIIKQLLEENLNVYILMHATDDFSLCQKLEMDFSGNPCVFSIMQNLNALELEDIISKFDFIIASRYHGAVNAFRNTIPVVAIGWDDKYLHLMQGLSQQDYYVDCAKGADLEKASSLVEKMIKNHKNEKATISREMGKIWKENPDVFGEIFSRLR